MIREQAVVPNEDGSYKLNLSKKERELLSFLVSQLRLKLRSSGGNDEVLTRLFPTSRPDDAEAEADYQKMVRNELISKRVERLDIMSSLIDAETINKEQLPAWVGAVNDCRLVLGTILDVSESEDYGLFVETDSSEDIIFDNTEAVMRAFYYYLGYFLEDLVTVSADILE